MADSKTLLSAKRGRGALTNPASRFESCAREDWDDGWDGLENPPERILTQLFTDTAKSALTYNNSPDVGFDRSINPYRGCEHGCIYCFARPTHAYLGLSPGLDFETKLYYKPTAPELLRQELSARQYRPAPIALGINTDAYQPIEKKLRLTRRLLELLHETRHPVSIITKSALIERDLDLLTDMAAKNLVHVGVSITTLQSDLARKLEPRAASPIRRLQIIETLAAAGVPTIIMVAPVIPILTDSELEKILKEARVRGAIEAGYVLLRLPLELTGLLRDWLHQHEPLKADHIFKRIYETRDGKSYKAEFGTRMRGTGIYADILQQRFRLAKKRLAFPGLPPYATHLFKAPADYKQMDLFD
jgi:DNA repair photolyase